MAGSQLNTILEKFQSKDKVPLLSDAVEVVHRLRHCDYRRFVNLEELLVQDFRYMATSDLQNELSKDTFRTDDLTEKRLCTLILQQLEDISGDISALAVKWCASD